jgi:hypothetical protein
MSFLQPAPPPFDLEEWRAKPYLARLEANSPPWLEESFEFPVEVIRTTAARAVVA